MSDEMGIQVALLLRVAVECLESGLFEPCVIVHASDVSGYRAYAHSFSPELLCELDDERRLPGPDGTHEIDGLDLVLLEHAVVLVS